jgi:predicted DNA-binding protein (MmcQ/YjbR family)
MTRQDIIDYCLSFPAAYENYPFGMTADEDATAVMRHRWTTSASKRDGISMLTAWITINTGMISPQGDYSA